MTIRKNKKQKGFSLVEVMLSVFVVLIGFIAAINLITSGLRESIDSRNQMIASFLAQEGLELVKNIRDNNWIISTDGFSNGLPVADNSDCRIDYSSSDVSCNNGNGSKILKLDSSTGLYSHATGSNTKFQRRIIVTYNGSSADVTSEVVWGRGESDFPSANFSDCNAASRCTYSTVNLAKDKFF